jgi:hypothetical protein
MVEAEISTAGIVVGIAWAQATLRKGERKNKV